MPLEECGGVLGRFDSTVGSSLVTGLLGTDPGHLFSSFASLGLDLGNSNDGWNVTLGDGMLLNAPPVGWKI